VIDTVVVGGGNRGRAVDWFHGGEKKQTRALNLNFAEISPRQD
jgi:hypothetical protein